MLRMRFSVKEKNDSKYMMHNIQNHNVRIILFFIFTKTLCNISHIKI